MTATHSSGVLPDLQRSVQTLLDRLVREGREIGIQVAAYHGPRKVVDAFAGRVGEQADAAAVSHETLFPLFSVAKGVVTLAAQRQMELGALDPDAPIASYWPEFGANGKGRVTMRHVLTHRSGVPQLPRETSLDDIKDWDRIVGIIAAQPLLHAAGEKSFYQAMTYGWMIGEAVRRTDPRHRPLETFVREEILAPLGIDAFFFTLDDTLRKRVGTLSGLGYPPLPDTSPMRIGMPPALDLTPAIFNTATMQSRLNPAVGGYANAASVARIFAMLANHGTLDGVRLFSPKSVERMAQLRPNPEEVDAYLGHATPLSYGGFWLGGPQKPSVGSRANILFSLGTGGSLGWADADYELAVAIVHNKMYYGQTPATDPALAIGKCIRAGLGIPD